jgi:anti-sigma regulatory factor (Ser/Thr protein kinase)
MISFNGFAARMTLSTDARLLRAGSQFVKQIALTVGLDEKTASRLELATEEAGLLLIDQSFEGKPTGLFDVICKQRPGQFIVSFEDKGLPFEWGRAAKAELSGSSVALLASFADELHLVNLGREGKRLEFIIAAESLVPDTSLQEFEDHEEETLAAAVLSRSDLVFRNADPLSDGVAFARCMFKVYGYTYVETVYFPDRVKSLIDQGLLMSFVAVTPSGDIVGHQGVKLATSEARVANSCMGAVDPDYRGMRIFETLKELALETMRERGFLGVHSEAVALHPYSQRANFKAGGRETGILLAYVPRGIHFNLIAGSDKLKEGRQTAVLYYNPINRAPSRVVHCPQNHQTIVEAIYSWVGLERSFCLPGADADLFLPEDARVDFEMAASTGLAFIKISQAGRDALPLVRAHLEDLKYGKIDVMYVDVPIAWPCAPWLVAGLEKMGFSFCGVMPEHHQDGDLLRLHHLNQLRIEPSEIVTINEMGQRLLDYSLAELVKAART